MGNPKDQTLLEGVSDYFTEETLENILCTIHNGKKAQVLSWDFGDASVKGDSYLSTVNRIKVTGLVDGKKRQVSLVVKSLPKNIGRRKTYRSAEFFRNEILFYTKVVPKFEKFLKEKGQSHLLNIPRHLSSVVDGENDYIALEDVSLLGFDCMSRQNCIDLQECTMLLKALARFHAISFAYKDQMKDEFVEAADNLRETYMSDAHWNWYKNFHKRLISISKHALAKECPGSIAEKRFSSYAFGDLFNKCIEFCSRKNNSTSVVNQGDCWAPNFLSRKVNGQIDVLMLDFQLARCASPVLDISFCIYSCTDKTLWDKHFDELLEVYYKELSNGITLLGSNPEKVYPRKIFLQEVKEQFMFGLVFAMESVSFSILDESESFDLDTLIKGDDAVDIASVWQLKDIESKSGRLRLANVIVHGVEKGFI